jgi:hypothetical protein
MRSFLRTTLIAVAALGASAFMPGVASACGGFFCNQAQPVNQAAEGIIFADNGDGTVTAVIQIQYQGPSTNFSWLLPISSVPKSKDDIGIASNLALQRLQTATNPSYRLNTRIEGTCQQSLNFGAPSSGGTTAAAGGASSMGAEGPGAVTVEASGVVGKFDWAVISLDQSLADPADTAVQWLSTNGYDVPSGAPNLLGPYLEAGLYLLALKLQKGADTGSIRPIALTYTGTQPSIPVKLTAVAANDDMGVLTWLLGKSRAVPQNYLSLELNEARINWFNASLNYNSVVIDAANDAGGQGFVTEFAGASSTLNGIVWTQQEDQDWVTFQSATYQSFSDFFTQAYGRYGQYDGFWDATGDAITLPTGVTLDDFKLCPSCYADQIQFSPSVYLAELKKTVIDPMKLVQNLIDAHPELTRLYTTLSPEEMTLDPLFTFNADLPDVSNLHVADRVIECDPSLYQYQAPWRIELPQGGVVRGTAAQVGTWPNELSALAPNRRIVRTGASGPGKVVEDNSNAIGDGLATYNSNLPISDVGGAGGTSSGGGSSGSSGTNSISGSGGKSSIGGSSGGMKAGGGGGCNVAGGQGPLPALLVASALGSAILRRRRRR